MSTNENLPGGGPPIFDFGAAARAVLNLTMFASPNATSARDANLDAPVDPLQRSLGYGAGFNNPGEVCLGVIVDGSSATNCYKVQLDKKKSPVFGAAIRQSGQTALGVTELNTYAPGTQVLVFLPEYANHVYIIGGVPWANIFGNLPRGDISAASRKRVDDSHKRYYYMPEASMMSDYSAFMPIDGTQGGEWGGIASTGLRLSLDDFLVQMAVNEFTGVFGFYHDALLRVSGMNYQCWTGGSEREALIDESEYNDYSGYAPFYWEHFGVMKLGVDTINEYEPENILCASQQPWYSRWESKEKFQAPFHRSQEYRGYMGQGKRSLICCPPENVPDIWTLIPSDGNPPEKPFEGKIDSTAGAAPKCSAGPVQKTSYKEEHPIGLHEDNISLDGRRFIASAKGITLSKRMLLPVPTRIRRPEDGNGDRADQDYRPSGESTFGSGPEHKITGDLVADHTYPSMRRSGAILDLHAYLFNYAGLHPFHWHYKDFNTAEQQDLKHAKANQYVPTYSELVTKMCLPEPTEGKGLRRIKIDHRYEEQNFFETESFISLLEDGTVVLGDGFGAEIKMAGGSITISAPGDIWLKTGRDTNIWAGRELHARAKQHIELAATEKDVRIKAERNMLLLAGNHEKAQTGGILIESKSKKTEYNFDEPGDKAEFGGIVLRAPKADVVTHARNVFMRSGGSGADGLSKGDITLDCGDSKSDLVVKSDRVYYYLNKSSSSVGFYYGQAENEDPQVAQYFTEKLVSLSGNFYAEKNAFVGKNLIVDGAGIHTGPVLGLYPIVIPCTGDCPGQVQAAINQLNELIYVTLPDMARSKGEQLDQIFYTANKAGNDDTIKRAGFSFRKDEEYFKGEFVVFEDRWQQLARLGGQDGKPWDEKPVKGIAGETYPFPGKERFTRPGVFQRFDLEMVDPAGGEFKDKERGNGSGGLNGPYENPKYGTANPGTLKSDYKVIE